MTLVAALGVLYFALLIGWIGFVLLSLARQVSEEVEASEEGGG